MGKSYISSAGGSALSSVKSFNVKAPFDVRSVVDTYDDLYSKDTYSYTEVYVGMLVVVADTKDLYVCTAVPGARDTTQAKWGAAIKWKKIGDINIDLSKYVQFTDLVNYLTASDVEDFVSTDELEEVLADYASQSDLNLYVKTDDVIGYIEQNGDFVKSDEIKNFVEASDLAEYVSVDSLEEILTEKGLDDFVSQSDLNMYVSTKDLAEELSEYVTSSDLDNRLASIKIPENVSEFINDAGYLTKNDLPNFLEASDLDDYVKTEELANYIPLSELESLAAKSDLDGYVRTEDAIEYLTASDLDDYLKVSELPTNVSEFTNDAGYITSEEVPSIKTINNKSLVGEGNVDVLEVIEFTGSNTGELSQELYDKLAGEGCVVKYNNRIYHKSYVSPNGIDYTYIGHTLANDDVKYYYFTADSEFRGYTFGTTTDARARVFANQEISGETQELRNLVIGFDKFTIPDFLEASDLEDYVRIEDLTPYATKEDIANFVEQSDLDIYVKTNDILTLLESDYAKKEELVDFLTASDLEDYVRVEDIADVVRTDDLDYYVKVEDAVDFLTASDLDVYALKSELPVNVSELTNDAGYLTQHQDLSAYALKSELPLEGTFPTDSDSDSDIDDGYATVQGVIDYIDAYFEKKKDELEEPDYIYINAVKYTGSETPTSIYQMNCYEIDDDALTNGIIVLADSEVNGYYGGEGEISTIYSVVFAIEYPQGYTCEVYIEDEFEVSGWAHINMVSNPRYSTKMYGNKTYVCEQRETHSAADDEYAALGEYSPYSGATDAQIKYKIVINKN